MSRPLYLRLQCHLAWEVLELTRLPAGLNGLGLASRVPRRFVMDRASALLGDADRFALLMFQCFLTCSLEHVRGRRACSFRPMLISAAVLDCRQGSCGPTSFDGVLWPILSNLSKQRLVSRIRLRLFLCAHGFRQCSPIRLEVLCGWGESASRVPVRARCPLFRLQRPAAFP